MAGARAEAEVEEKTPGVAEVEQEQAGEIEVVLLQVAGVHAGELVGAELDSCTHTD